MRVLQLVVLRIVGSFARITFDDEVSDSRAQECYSAAVYRKGNHLEDEVQRVTLKIEQESSRMPCAGPPPLCIVCFGVWQKWLGA